jgi:hypothetical protein
VALSFPGRGLDTQEADEELSVSQALSGNIWCSTRVPEELIVFEVNVVHVTNRLSLDTSIKSCSPWALGW